MTEDLTPTLLIGTNRAPIVAQKGLVRDPSPPAQKERKGLGLRVEGLRIQAFRALGLPPGILSGSGFELKFHTPEMLRPVLLRNGRHLRCWLTVLAPETWAFRHSGVWAFRGP